MSKFKILEGELGNGIYEGKIYGYNCKIGNHILKLDQGIRCSERCAPIRTLKVHNGYIEVITDKEFSGLSAVGPLFVSRSTGPSESINIDSRIDPEFGIPKETLDMISQKRFSKNSGKDITQRTNLYEVNDEFEPADIITDYDLCDKVIKDFIDAALMNGINSPQCTYISYIFSRSHPNSYVVVGYYNPNKGNMASKHVWIEWNGNEYCLRSILENKLGKSIKFDKILKICKIKGDNLRYDIQGNSYAAAYVKDENKIIYYNKNMKTSRTFSRIPEVSEKDLMEFNYWIKGRKITPTFRKYFKSDKEYEDYMINAQDNWDKKPNRKFTEDKCPDTGCIQPDPENEGKWMIISNKTGEPWKPRYDSQEKAEAALAAYHSNRKFSNNKRTEFDVLIVNDKGSGVDSGVKMYLHKGEFKNANGTKNKDQSILYQAEQVNLDEIKSLVNKYKVEYIYASLIDLDIDIRSFSFNSNYEYYSLDKAIEIVKNPPVPPTKSYNRNNSPKIKLTYDEDRAIYFVEYFYQDKNTWVNVWDKTKITTSELIKEIKEWKTEYGATIIGFNLGTSHQDNNTKRVFSRVFTDANLTIDNDPSIIKENQKQRYVNTALQAGNKETIMNFNNGKPFFMSEEPYLVAEVISDVADGIYIGSIKSNQISVGEKLIDINVSLTADFPEPILSIIRGKKAYIWKANQLVKSDAVKNFSIIDDIKRIQDKDLRKEYNRVQKGIIGDITKEIEKNFSMKSESDFDKFTKFLKKARIADIEKDNFAVRVEKAPVKLVTIYGFGDELELIANRGEEDAIEMSASVIKNYIKHGYTVKINDQYFMGGGYDYSKDFSVNSDEEFIKACHEMAKDVFGDSYDEAVTEKTARGVLSDQEGDYDKKLGIFRNGLKGFSRNDESDLKEILNKLSKLTYDKLDSISDAQWDKFEKINDTDKSASTIIQSAIGYEGIDSDWINNAITQLAEISRRTGTELSMYTEFANKLLGFINSGGNRVYSNPDTGMINYGFEINPDQLTYDMDHVIGSLMFSVTYAHLYHLIRSSYSSHKALNEYYDEMPEKVDALAEAYLANTNIAKFACCIIPTTPDPIDYFESLKKFIIDYPKSIQGGLKSNIQSLLDDVLNTIESVLYKLKRLSSGGRTFSSVEDKRTLPTNPEYKKLYRFMLDLGFRVFDKEAYRAYGSDDYSDLDPLILRAGKNGDIILNSQGIQFNAWSMNGQEYMFIPLKKLMSERQTRSFDVSKNIIDNSNETFSIKDIPPTNPQGRFIWMRKNEILKEVPTMSLYKLGGLRTMLSILEDKSEDDLTKFFEKFKINESELEGSTWIEDMFNKYIIDPGNGKLLNDMTNWLVDYFSNKI